MINRKGLIPMAAPPHSHGVSSPPSSLRRHHSGPQELQQQRRKPSQSLSHLSNKLLSSKTVCFVGTILSLLLLWFWYLTYLIQTKSVRFFHGRQWTLQHRLDEHAAAQMINPFCRFRRYAHHRYYHLQRSSPPPPPAAATASSSLTDHPQPDFLTRAEYIHGDWPILLQEHEAPVKLCVNQSAWFHPPRTTTSTTAVITTTTTNTAPDKPAPATTTTTTVVWPFADGTNPSLLHLSRLRAQAPAVAKLIGSAHPDTEYIVTVCMTNSQCTWKDVAPPPDTPTNQATSTLAPMIDLPDLTQTQPDTVRTMLQLLNGQLEHIVETTIYLQRDAAWGKRYPDPNNPTTMHLPSLDDARLFVYNGQVYVSYREGPSFGYDAQVLNPIHWDFALQPQFTATIRASESSAFCCGRNMALLPDFAWSSSSLATASKPTDGNSAPVVPPLLHALTWVDPVTVEAVDTTPLIHRKDSKTKRSPKRRLGQSVSRSGEARKATSFKAWNATTIMDETATRRRRLIGGDTSTTTRSAQKHKSHIHGTNAFMVPLPASTASRDRQSREFLGVAHFHRPNDRKPNEYARFGHHYTHAFYTVSSDDDSTTLDASSFWLSGLSSEFVLPAIHAPDNAEIIQFVSGLEYNPETKQVILAYGINDCEAAVTTLDLSTVQTMLKSVPKGQQVVDFMFPLKDTSSR
jgi:hypothetical protein